MIFISLHTVEIYYIVIVFYLPHTHTHAHTYVYVCMCVCVLNVYIGSDVDDFTIKQKRSDRNMKTSKSRRMIKYINAMDFTCSTH
jgi:hypothetical protein